MLINDLPMKLQGLHMIIHDNGDLERVIVDDEKEYELPPMNLKEVIIDLSEMRHDGYIILLQAKAKRIMLKQKDFLGWLMMFVTQ